MDQPLSPPEHQAEVTSAAFKTCYARLEADQLIVGNDCIERRWQIHNGRLFPMLLRDVAAGFEWITPVDSPAPTPNVGLGAAASALTFTADSGTLYPTEALSLRIQLAVDFQPLQAGDNVIRVVYCFQIFPGIAAITTTLSVDHPGSTPETGERARSVEPGSTPSGIETSPAPPIEELPALDRLEMLHLLPSHLRFVQVTLLDQTDHHNELVFEREWRLHPSETAIDLAGNLFIFEDVFSGQGLIFLKHAPLPHARPVPNAVSGGHDLLLRPRVGQAAFYGHGNGSESGGGYPWGVITYSGGMPGRTLALHAYQRQFRQFDPDRDARFLSNTWGDRSRDSRINEDFMRQEIEAGARLGVDVIQIDDGWETGRTANSATPGGVWNGFWASNAAFWKPNPERFPHGLEPIIAEARALGLAFGLWFAPDSSDSFANWQRDADVLLDLHHSLGVNYFKIDGVKAVTRAGERNLHAFFERVLTGSHGKVVFDLDVTAEIRPGYFGAIHCGPLFVENRYTDWHRYWPHATLRNLWKLSHYVDPARLRFEFLNNSRNIDLYPDDPLAPSAYSPAYLFATTLFANPLGWFEMSSLPQAYFDQVAPLAQVWKQHRAEIFANRILPIGDAPDGSAWTGFVSLAPDGCSGIALVFRELNERPSWQTSIPCIADDRYNVQTLSGDGSAQVSGGQLSVTLPQPLSYGFFRFHH